MIGASTASSLLVTRLGYRVPMLLGMGLLGLTLVLLSFGWTSLAVGGVTLGGFWLMSVMLLLSGLGMGAREPGLEQRRPPAAVGRPDAGPARR